MMEKPITCDGSAASSVSVGTMQTFLPYASFYRSVHVLDSRRLGKQRVEAFQILNVMDRIRLDPDGKIAWRNHPAVRMWMGYEEALKLYYNFCVMEWISRGHRNTMLLKPVVCANLASSYCCTEAPLLESCTRLKTELCLLEKQVIRPPFIGKRAFHVSHQSNLLRKDEAHYRQYFARVSADLEYIWPA